MDLIEKILAAKKMQGISWSKLAEGLPVKGDSLRAAFDRRSVDKVYLQTICDKLKIETRQSVQSQDRVIEPANGYGIDYLLEENKFLKNQIKIKDNQIDSKQKEIERLWSMIPSIKKDNKKAM